MADYDLQQLKVPWVPAGKPAKALAAELGRECGKQHTLFGKDATAIARREDCDDVLFLVDDKFAVVHLTFSRRREENPIWPATQLFFSWEEFVHECVD